MKKSPDPRAQCPNCGAHGSLVEFMNESRVFGQGNHSLTLEGLSGVRCSSCNEVIYDSASLDKVASAVDELSNLRKGAALRRIRKNVLHLTQKEAVSLLSGGGHNAFSRYEKGLVSVPKSLMVLMMLLEKKPELINEIKQLRMNW